MAENTPQPPAGAKPQGKKETVRINLPPKPTAAPTIKIPAPPAAAAAPAAKLPTAVPAAALKSAAPAAAPAAPMAIKSVAPRRAVGVSGLDQGLAVVAFVVILLALGSLFIL